jgi:hypothetical protein
MPRRIDIELTSSRDDGTWTWRAAGAKAPKGTVAGTLLPEGSKVNDVLKVDAEFFVDGIEITGVVPAKGARKEPERLELIVPEGRDEPLVTTTLATRSRSERGPRRDGPGREGPRREGRDGPRREGGRREGGAPGKDRSPGDRREGRQGRDGERGPRREDGDRPPRRDRPQPPPMPVVERPKAKRLRAGKAHRNALLESLPEEQRPIAEQVVLGGLPAVRQAIEKQNAERAAAGEPAIAAGPLVEIAEKLVRRVRAAEWRDRAEAAQRDLEHLDLRDLRSVVSTADAAGKDEEARALAQSLREGLAARVDAEHATWLNELTATVDVGRIVRALRISSRPPKAGSPLPAELSARLIAGAGEALTADAPPERWVAVLDALAFAPVRDKVIPASLPKELHADVQATIARLATRIPKIAHIFEVTPDRNAPRPKPERRRPPKPKLPKPKSEAKTPPPKSEADGSEADKPQAEGSATASAEPKPDTQLADSAPSDPKPEVDVAETAEIVPTSDSPQAQELSETSNQPPEAAPAPEPEQAQESSETNDQPAEDAPAPEPAEAQAQERAETSDQPAAGALLPDPEQAPELQPQETESSGEAAGGAGVSPADAPEAGSAVPLAPSSDAEGVTS